MSDPSATATEASHSHNHAPVDVATNHSSSSRSRGRPYRGHRGPRRDREPREPRESRESREPRDPAHEARKIYVGNLPYMTTKDDLHDHFAAIGPIEKVMIARRYGRSLGFGFVVFEDEASVSKAVAEMTNTTIGDRTIAVETIDLERESAPKLRRTHKPRAKSHDGETNGDEGTATEGDEPNKDSYSSRRKPRGRRDHKPSAADDATIESTGTDRKPRRRISRKPISETGTPLPTTVYVRGLGHGVTEEMLREAFICKDLNPVKIEIRIPRVFRSRGFALVELANTEARDRAIEQVAGVEVAGKTLIVQIAYAPASRTSQTEAHEDGHGVTAETTHSGVLTKGHDVTGTHPAEVTAEAAKAE